MAPKVAGPAPAQTSLPNSYCASYPAAMRVALAAYRLMEEIAKSHGGLDSEERELLAAYRRALGIGDEDLQALHLELDLALSPAIDEYGVESDFYTTDIIDQMRIGGRRLHKLAESRRIRAPSWHYYDHPLFGVIARIEKVVVEP